MFDAAIQIMLDPEGRLSASVAALSLSLARHDPVLSAEVECSHAGLVNLMAVSTSMVSVKTHTQLECLHWCMHTTGVTDC